MPQPTPLISGQKVYDLLKTGDLLSAALGFLVVRLKHEGECRQLSFGQTTKQRAVQDQIKTRNDPEAICPNLVDPPHLGLEHLRF